MSKSILECSQLQSEFCNLLRLWIEEWGNENIFIQVPTGWQDEESEFDAGGVPVQFVTDTTVALYLDQGYAYLKREYHAA